MNLENSDFQDNKILSYKTVSMMQLNNLCELLKLLKIT